MTALVFKREGQRILFKIIKTNKTKNIDEIAELSHQSYQCMG